MVRQNSDKKRGLNSRASLNQTVEINLRSLDSSPEGKMQRSPPDDSAAYYNDYFNKRSGTHIGVQDLTKIRMGSDSIGRAGSDIISSHHPSSRNALMSNAKAYTTNKAMELKAKQYEDEWALILKADLDKKNQLEQEKLQSKLN